MCSAWSHTALGNGSKDSAVVVAALEAQRDCAQERALRVLLPAHGSSHTQGFRTPEEAVQLRARISWQPCHILGAPQEFPISPRRHCRSSSWCGRHQEPAGAHRPCCASLDSFPSLLSFWSNVNVMSSRGLYRYSLWVLIWDLYREQEPRGSPVLQWLEAQAPSAPAAEGGMEVCQGWRAAAQLLRAGAGEAAGGSCWSVKGAVRNQRQWAVCLAPAASCPRSPQSQHLCTLVPGERLLLLSYAGSVRLTWDRYSV